MKTKLKKVSVYKLVFLLEVLLLYLPTANISNQFLIISSMIFQICLLFYTLYKKRMHFDNFEIMVIAFEVWFVFSGLINGTNYTWFLKIGLKIISATLFSSLMFKRNAEKYLMCSIGALSIYASINLFQVLFIGPTSYDMIGGKMYFLGTDNQASSLLIALFILSFIYILLYRVKVIPIVGMVIAAFSSFYVLCGAAVMAYIIFAIMIIVGSVPALGKTVEKNTRYLTFVFLYLLFTVLLIVLSLNFQGSYLDLALYRLTGKNITFSGRIDLWLYALRIIKNHPIFGIGLGGGGNGVYSYKYGMYLGAHSQVLQWGVFGGVTAIIIFLILLFKSLKRTEKMTYKHRWYILCSITIYLMAMSMELYDNGLYLFLILALCNNLPVNKRKFRENGIAVSADRNTHSA